ncbi:hypothetical protein GF324_06430 [bacterium]|nr:hypothetical protein [bacterium]
MDNSKPRFPRAIIWASFAAMVMAVIAVFALQMVKRAQIADQQKPTMRLPAMGEVPAYKFTDQFGESFGTADYKGRVSIHSFQFSHCEGVCPVMSGHLVNVWQQYRDDDGWQIVTVSVDPKRDTPDVLRDYIDQFPIPQERWHYLRGPINEVVELSEKGFYLPAENLPMGHSAKFVLVDRTGKIRGYFNSQDLEGPQLLKEALGVLLNETQPSTAEADGSEAALQDGEPKGDCCETDEGA